MPRANYKFALLFVFALCGIAAHAQVITLTVNSGSNLNIPSLTPAAINSFGTVNVSTTWTLQPGQTSIDLYGYFDNASAALTHTDPTNTVDIPSAAISASLNGGAYASFTGTVPFGAGNAGLRFWSVHITGTNKNSNRTDNITLRLNLTLTTPTDLTKLPADTYTGTLHIRAQATP